MSEFNFERSDAIWELKADIMKIAASLCIFSPLCFLSANLFMYIYSAFSKVPGKELSAHFIESGFYPFYLIFVTIIPIMCSILLLNKLTERKLSPHSFKPTIKGKTFSLFVLLGLGSIYLSAFLGDIWSKFLSQFNLDNSSELSIPTNTFGIIVFLICTCILTPILEEYLFRGIILEKLMPYGSIFAVLTSSFLFAIMHSTFSAQLPIFFMGVVFALLALYSGSPAASAVVHAVNNLISCILSLMSKTDYYQSISSYLSIILISLLIVSAVSYALLSNKGALSVVLKKCPVSPIRRLVIVVFCPAVLFLIAIFLVTALLNLGG